MKKFILLIIIISTCLNINGQVRKRYWKNLEAYVGTWMYQSNDTTIYLKMAITEVNYKVIDIAPYNIIIGGYKIIVNGVVTENTYDNFKHVSENKKYTPIFANNDREKPEEVNPNKLRLVVRMSRTSEYGDKFPNYQFPGELVLVSKDELIWTVGANTKYPYQPREGRRGSPPSWAYPLPEYAVFKKISDSYD